MKTKIVCLFFVLFSITVNAQEQTTEKVSTKTEDVYRDVDVMANYQGGYKVLLKKIETATKHCRNGKFKGKDAGIVVDVLVDKQGKVVKVDFVKMAVDLCENEIRNAIETSNQWRPALIKSKPVNSYITLNINLLSTY